MEQLELDLGLQPIQKWLHVWSEAERANKKTAARQAVNRAAVKPDESDRGDRHTGGMPAHQAASSSSSGQ